MQGGTVPLLAAIAHWAKQGLEAAGMAAILLGTLLTAFGFLRDALAGRSEAGYHQFRARLGRAILLGLELLVAADIVGTVVAPLDLQSTAALGLVVLIRTLLSLSIEVEISGRWPWQAGRPPRDQHQA